MPAAARGLAAKWTVSVAVATEVRTSSASAVATAEQMGCEWRAMV
jgi:hypothetical protein